MRKLLGMAGVAVLLLGAAIPGSASHAAECADEYVCSAAGAVWTATAVIESEGRAVSLEAVRRDETRFSSEGHAETSAKHVHMTWGDGDCAADPAAITYEASEVIHVISTDPACALDLTFTPTGTPQPATDRDVRASPGIPTMFDTFVIVSLGATVTRDAAVAGTLLGAAVGATGRVREHRYAGHVTLIS